MFFVFSAGPSGVEFIVSRKKNKKEGNSVPVGDKTAHVKNLVLKKNWPKIREMAANGCQPAVEALRRRESAKIGIDAKKK